MTSKPSTSSSIIKGLDDNNNQEEQEYRPESRSSSRSSSVTSDYNLRSQCVLCQAGLHDAKHLRRRVTRSSSVENSSNQREIKSVEVLERRITRSKSKSPSVSSTRSSSSSITRRKSKSKSPKIIQKSSTTSTTITSSNKLEQIPEVEEYSYISYDQQQEPNKTKTSVKRQKLSQEESSSGDHSIIIKKKKIKRIVDSSEPEHHLSKTGTSLTNIKQLSSSHKNSTATTAKTLTLKNYSTTSTSNTSASNNNKKFTKNNIKKEKSKKKAIINSNKQKSSIVPKSNDIVSVTIASSLTDEEVADNNNDQQAQQLLQQHQTTQIHQFAVGKNQTNISSINSSKESDLDDQIHSRYREYFLLENNLKDQYKTDYTYAHSFSYSPLVPAQEQYNWMVPNMSRPSVRHRGTPPLGSGSRSSYLSEENTRRFFGEDIPVSRIRNQHVVTKTTTTITKKNSSSSNNDGDHLIEKYIHEFSEQSPVLKSTPIKILNNKQHFEYSDDDDQDDDNDEHNQTTIFTPMVTRSKHRLQQHQQQHENLRQKRAISRIAGSRSGQYSEEDTDEEEEETLTLTIIRQIRRYFITTIRYLPFVQKLVPEIDEDLQMQNIAHNMNYASSSNIASGGHDDDLLLMRNGRRHRTTTSSQAYHQTKRQILWSWCWPLWLLLLLTLLLFILWPYLFYALTAVWPSSFYPISANDSDASGASGVHSFYVHEHLQQIPMKTAQATGSAFRWLYGSLAQWPTLSLAWLTLESLPSFSWFGASKSSPSSNHWSPSAELSQLTDELFRLKQDMLSIKTNQDSLERTVQLNVAQQQQPPSTPPPMPSIDIDALLNRLAQLETRLQSCCSRAAAVTPAPAPNPEMVERLVQQMLDPKLVDLQQRYNDQLNNVKSAMIRLMEERYGLFNTSLDQMKLDLDRLEQKARAPPIVTVAGSSGADSSDVQNMIRKALAKYDADKTGEADYALESTGAYVLKTRCSEAYEQHSASYKMFGFTIWRTHNSPRQVLTSTVVPGECWAFQGSEGRLAIRLAARIIPTAFAYEHIPVRLSRDGHILSAPNRFQVYGLVSEDDENPKLLGEYNYNIVSDLNDANELDKEEPLQRFPVQFEDVAKQTFNMIELVVKSNHGHPEYTCLYRFRVHGIPVAN